MPFFLLILVSVIQGLTEFLPVSSSGHLALIPVLTDQPYQGRTIDVAAHVGTLGAVMWYLRADLIAMLRAVLPLFAAADSSGRRRAIRPGLGIKAAPGLPPITTRLPAGGLHPL